MALRTGLGVSRRLVYPTGCITRRAVLGINHLKMAMSRAPLPYAGSQRHPLLFSHVIASPVAVVPFIPWSASGQNSPA